MIPLSMTWFKGVPLTLLFVALLPSYALASPFDALTEFPLLDAFYAWVEDFPSFF